MEVSFMQSHYCSKMATNKQIRGDMKSTMYRSFIACDGNMHDFLEKCEIALAEVNRLKRAAKKTLFKNHHKAWTKKENAQLMMLYKAGCTQDKISEKLQRAPKAIEYRLANCLIKEQNDNGLTLDGLGKKFNKSRARIIGEIDVGRNTRRRSKRFASRV